MKSTMGDLVGEPARNPRTPFNRAERKAATARQDDEKGSATDTGRVHKECPTCKCGAKH